MGCLHDREFWRNALWWARSQQPGVGLIYASAALRRTLFAAHQRVALVIGSYGKTTTTRTVRAALGLTPTPWTESNPNTLGEVAWSLLREAAWSRHAVVEAGIGGPGQMAKYVGVLRPRTTIVTWLGHEHLRAFADFQSLRNEKAIAVRCLPAHGTAILNGDDPNVRWMATQTQARVVWFGTSPDCDVWADDVQLDWPRGLRFTLHAGGDCRQMQIQLVGRRNLHCALAAIAAGLEAGVPLDVLVERVVQVRSTRCRLQAFPLPIGATIIRDEYKATPDTALEALRLLSEAPATRRIVVIGDLNNVPSLPVEPYYERVGAAVGAVADLVVVVGTTLPKYLPGLRNSGLADSQIIEADDVHQAIRTLRREIRSGDVVLLKGRENDRLSRIALALSGADVKCARTTCEAYLQFCDDCPLLCRAA